MAKYPTFEEIIRNNLLDNIDESSLWKYETVNATVSPADWRYIELKGYMFSAVDLKSYGIRKGIRCMNCYSMVYLNKCTNDQCYNFYVYCNNTKVDGLEDEFWELVFKQHPELKEKDNV